jgi:hypothetical protein
MQKIGGLKAGWYISRPGLEFGLGMDFKDVLNCESRVTSSFFRQKSRVGVEDNEKNSSFCGAGRGYFSMSDLAT